MKTFVFKSLIQTTLFQSLIPLALGALLSIISEQMTFRQNPNDVQSLSWLEELLVSFKNPIFERIWSLYNIYWKFMLLMIITNLIIYGIKNLIKDKTKKRLAKLRELNKRSDKSFSGDDEDLKLQKRFLSVGKFMFCSTVIFCFYQVLSLCVTSIPPESQIHNFVQYPRSLEENSIRDLSESLEEPTILTEKPISRSLSLSLGKMISSLNIDAYSIVVSPDSKTAYTTLLRTGTLKVIDISDLDFPKIISSLSLHILKVDYPDKALYLSPNGRTLFASTFQVLEIIDVSFPHQPTILSKLIHPNLPEGLPGLIPQAYKISFALSIDLRTLYVAAFGLEIFDISNLTKPELVSTDINGMKGAKNELVIISSIAISSHCLFLANNSLGIYNISRPHNPVLISNLEAQVPINSIALSKDNITLFALGSDDNKRVVLEKINIADRKNPQIIESDILDIYSSDSPYIVTLSPNSENILIHTNERKVIPTNTFPLIEFSNDLRVFNPHKRVLIDNTKSLVSHVYSAFFLPNEDKLILTSNDQFTILQLYLNYPNQRAFSLSTNSLAYFPTKRACNSLALSSDGKTLFLAVGDSNTDSSLIVLNVSNNSQPVQIMSYNAQEFDRDSQVPTLLKVSASDDQRIYMVLNREILIIDAATSSPTLVGSLTKANLLPTEYSSEFKVYAGDRWKEIYYLTAFEVSQDDSLGFILQDYDLNNCVVKIMNIQNPKSITKISEFMLPRRSFDYRMALTTDGQTLFVVQKMMLIYDVSNPASPKLINSVIVTLEDGDPHLLAVTLSSDNKYLFIKTMIENFLYLKIYNLEDVTFPMLISEFPLPKYTTYLPANPQLENFIALTSDNQLAYVDTIDKDISNYLLVVNMTNLESPVIQKVLPALNNSLMNSFKLSHDGKIGYAATKTGLQIFNFEPKYSLFLQSESFLLGHRSFVNALILKLNSSGEYVIMEEQYKFTKFSIFNMKIKPNENSPKLTFTTPPYWMTFDKENQILTIDPKSHNDLGTFTLYSAFSRKISLDAFKAIESLKDIKSLIITLVALGYIDNQYFLTSRFGSKEDFFLPNDYSQLEEEEIYRILEQYYTETFTTFDIISSIEVNFGGKISVHTMDPNAVKVDIKLNNLENQTQCQFVNKAYGLLQPVIIDRKSHLTIEGSLKEINRALQEIVINLEERKSCPGVFIVTDYMNPPFSAFKYDLSEFFKRNGYPAETSNPNLTVQSQIDKAKIFTGQYFTINMNEKTFRDSNIDILSYQIVMDDEERSDLPTWLAFSDLALKGTPPEVIFGRDIGLIIIAKNEFKQVEVKFNLHISISPIFVMKLIIRYSPYLLTLIGLWISANKIYNVIAKRLYKHPKEFEIEYGKEIEIFPVMFIGEVRSDYKIIMKSLRGDLMFEKGIELIEEKIEKIVKKNKEILKGYRTGLQKRRDLIQRLIVNEMILRQLEDGDENLKKTFNKVKDKWPEYIYYDNNNFKVDETKLLNCLQNPVKIMESNENSLLSSSTSQILLTRSDLDIELLKNALEVYAFQSQSVNLKARSSRIVLKEKVEKGWIERFLKRDLSELKPAGNLCVDYGIKYEIKNSRLRFYGVPEEDVQGKTFVVQITTSKHKILKEIYIHGKTCETMNGRKEEMNTEEGYEVF